jgi:hypothetical protein
VSAAFSVAVYLAVGAMVAIWLHSRGKLAQGPAILFAAALLWPAYLPVCLAAEPAAARDREGVVSGEGRDPIFAALERQIARMPLDASRKSEHLASVSRIERALASRRHEIERVDAASKRLLELAGCLGAGDRDERLVEEELARLEVEKQEIGRELARVREAVVRLTLRIELFEVRASKASLEEQLAELKEELGRLLDAQNEVESMV